MPIKPNEEIQPNPLYTCPKCNRVFRSKIGLNNHNRAKFPCDQPHPVKEKVKKVEEDIEPPVHLIIPKAIFDKANNTYSKYVEIANRSRDRYQRIHGIEGKENLKQLPDNLLCFIVEKETAS